MTKIFSLSESECEWAEYKSRRVWSNLLNFSIHIKRDKKYNLFTKIYKKTSKKFLKG